MGEARETLMGAVRSGTQFSPEALRTPMRLFARSQSLVRDSTPISESLNPPDPKTS